MSKRDDIARYIVHLIDTKPLRPGDVIPSERDLEVAFGVARETVRRAIDDLVQDGRVEKRQGLGTFVLGPNTGPEGPIVDIELVRLRQIEALVRELFEVEDEIGAQRVSAVPVENERDEAEIEDRLRELVGMERPKPPVLEHQRRCPYPEFDCTCRRTHLLVEAHRLANLIPEDDERPE